ncbi:MAG: transcription-repair coupling factor, partial [Lachnospiraceae bacterium]|nr:transcription-repair coupling factor [Lachnospiraceae bacterium]
DFVNGETDVLVSTTIIETGLDISNVNTMIVHDADRMGLSQLYQLRGRVGRSDRTAYAFLMYRRGKLLKEEAQKRLSAIRDFTELGSGFRIAMRDLEIRGAGNLLGHAQHGHMQAVGYDLYCKLLDTAVKKAKGIETKREQSASVNLSADAFIPESYILNEAQKMDIYKKIALIGSTEDLEDIRAELLDRFGQVPASAENLLRIALIRAIAGRLDISDITGYAGTIRFTFQPQADVKVEGIPSLLKIYGGALSFAPRPEPSLTYRFKPTGVTVRDEEMLLSMTEDVLVKISEQLRQ